jgi:hypothetical protein
MSEETLGRAALERITPQLRDIPESEVEVPRLDVAAAAVAVVPIARFAASEAARARFASIPPALFDVRLVDELEGLARAARYARTAHASALAAKPGEARVPVEVQAEAAEVRARMLRLVSYWFDEDATLGPVVADIRRGTGYMDLGQDLNRLARIYRGQADTVRRDALNYRDDDAARADALAERIFDALGLQPKTRLDTADTLARAWTLLRRTYDEVAATGRWLYRDEGGEALFPPLYSFRRVSAPSAKAAEPESPVPVPA